jgi:hypothetical protein
VAQKTQAKTPAKASQSRGSGRYTAPKPKSAKRSPLWVPSVMTTSLVTGLLVIVLNYLNLLPGDHAENRYLFLGLGLVVFGFALAANYK